MVHLKSLIIIFILKILLFPKLLAQNQESNKINNNLRFTQMNQNCDIKIFYSKEDVINGYNAIYDNGQIQYMYQQYSPFYRLSTIEQNIDKFFILESLNPTTNNYNTIKIEIISSNNSLTKPIYKISSEDISISLTNKQLNSLEIIYDCNKFTEGKADIKLLLNPENCGQIVLEWRKECKGEFVGKNPFVNLSMIRNNKQQFILKDGEPEESMKYLTDKSISDSIPKEKFFYEDSIIFKIMASRQNLDYKVLPFQINPPDNSIIHPLIKGDIATTGGKIGNEKEFYVSFQCKFIKDVKDDYFTNFQLQIPFENGQNINIHMTKLCKIPRMSLIARIIYYFLLFHLIIIFLIILFFILLYYLSKDEDFKFKDFLLKVKEKIIDEIVVKLKSIYIIKYLSSKIKLPENFSNYIPILKKNSINNNNYNNKLEFDSNEAHMENGEEENDILDIRISFDRNSDEQKYYDCI